MTPLLNLMHGTANCQLSIDCEVKLIKRAIDKNELNNEDLLRWTNQIEKRNNDLKKVIDKYYTITKEQK